jgi:hypothetical protein
MNALGVLSHHFDGKRGPDCGFETAQIRGEVLCEDDGVRGGRKLPAQFVVNSELVVRVEEESHGTSKGSNMREARGAALIFVKPPSAARPREPFAPCRLPLPAGSVRIIEFIRPPQ